MKIEHKAQEFRPIAKREKTDMFITDGFSIDKPDFDVRINENYYIIR